MPRERVPQERVLGEGEFDRFLDRIQQTRDAGEATESYRKATDLLAAKGADEALAYLQARSNQRKSQIETQANRRDREEADLRKLLQEELQSIWRRDRKTALFVTHDIDEAIYLGTRVVVFSARPGRVKADIRIPVGIDRSSEFRKSPVYNEMRIQIWDLLREEVLKARAEQES